jgi:thiol-disulfide isomerase/thioredoxin
MSGLGTGMPTPALFHTNGTEFSWAETENRPVLAAFICNHCPFVLHILKAFTRLLNTYHPDIFVLAINSNDVAAYPQDGPEAMHQLAVTERWTFPFLFDATQEAAKAFSAACTPDFFLYDATHSLVYRGQFDDSRPGNGVVPQGTDLENALKTVLSGRKPETIQKPSLGCNIKWKPGNEPAYFRPKTI